MTVVLESANMSCNYNLTVTYHVTKMTLLSIIFTTIYYTTTMSSETIIHTLLGSVLNSVTKTGVNLPNRDLL